jgi:alpha-mannosidase/mannosylglycerate hydrolase
MSQQKTTAIYVVSTHWDREWYEPFQGFRYYLVELLDEVLDTMAADERFACFQTDGQSIILEDYLEIRPEREEQVRRFAQAGRLRIGPWYTMPDENLVAPEALIRNLEEGIRVARGFGNVSKVGFVCDIFGHVAQLPQIFRQFGIKGAFVFRGVNEDTHGGAFRWSGADGTEIPALRFGPNEGYCDLAGKIRMGTGPEGSFGLDEAVQKLAGYVDGQRLRTGMNTVLLFDGADHLPIEPQTVALVEGLRRARPDLDVRFGGLDEFAVALEEHAARLERKAEGELRAPGRLVNDGACLIPGVLSSRMRLKQANRACESDLLLWAEPFSHMASMLTGAEYPHGFIRHAWRNLLQNHAHDSICGCSPDQVHKDMEYRFDQARLIAEKVTESALRRIAARVKAPNVAGEDLVLVVFNPSQAAVDGPVDLELWFDVNTRNTFGEFFNFESKVGFRLLDADGVEVPYDYLGYAPRRKRFERVHRKFPRSEDCIVVRVTAPLRVPALGYATLVCRPEPARTRHPAGSLVTSTCSMENEHLRVEVQSNGSLSLLDKRT